MSVFQVFRLLEKQPHESRDPEDPSSPHMLQWCKQRPGKPLPHLRRQFPRRLSELAAADTGLQDRRTQAPLTA